MSFSESAVVKRTATLSTLGQIMTALGAIAIVLGCIGLAAGLALEFTSGDRYDGPLADAARIQVGISTLLWGLALSAGGAALHALRSIAVNCAKMAERD
jgi:hypothetical protein